jgi:iron complex outermembrane receptor protein
VTGVQTCALPISTLELSDTLRLKNIISYSELRQWYAYDYDATTMGIAGQGQRGDIPTVAPDTFTEELQLQGTLFDEAVTFAAGGYYDKLVAPQGGAFLQFPFSLLLGGPFRANIDSRLESKAVFGQATADMGALGWIDGLSITAGYRYTWENYRSSVVIIAPPAAAGEGDFHYGSYNFSIDYDVTDGVHVYLTLRDAYKTGGVNAGIPASSPYAKFEPEKLEDIEIGLKSQFRLGDVPIRANIAAYRGDYTNVQRTTTEIVGPVALNVTRSAAEGRIQGVEFTGLVVPFDGLTLNGSFSYTDAKYTKVASPSAAAILAGSPFPYTPKTKFTLGITYERPLGDNLGTLVLGANYASQSSFSTAQTNASYIRYLKGYDTLSLTADLKDVGGRPVDLQLFVTNATDEEYATGVADFYNQAFGVATQTYGEPRMYGVRLRYRFGE